MLLTADENFQSSAENILAAAKSGPTDPASTSWSGRATTCLADVSPTAVRWLWKGWFAFGCVSIFDGDSDVGKSTVTLNWASIVSNGARWPATVINGKTLVSQHAPADVVLVGVEDDESHTVVPRLIAAGADRHRVHSLKRPVDDFGKPKPFTIPADIDWLRQAVIETNAKLVVIDPITACLPDETKHGVDASIRRILMHLVMLAQDTNCAIVLIRHFNKSKGMSAIHRGGGSVAYSALARSVLTVARLAEPDRNGATFAIARAIGNLSKPPDTIGYALHDAPDMEDLPAPEDDELKIAVVKWCGTIDIDADHLVGADIQIDSRKAAPLRDGAERDIESFLANGSAKMEEVVKSVSQSVPCSPATVKNAAAKMKDAGRLVRKPVYDTSGKIDYWQWQLAPKVIPANSGQGPQ